MKCIVGIVVLGDCLFYQPWTHALIPGWLNPGATNELGPCRWRRGPTGKAGVGVSRTDWPMSDPRGGEVGGGWAGRPRRLDKEAAAAGGDWLRSWAERPGKGRRKEAGAGRAAARRWQLSRWCQSESDSSRGWQRPREQDAGPGRADAAAVCNAAGLGLGIFRSVSAPSDWRPGATAPPACIPGQGLGSSS